MLPFCCYTNVMFQYGREKPYCDAFVTESYSQENIHIHINEPVHEISYNLTL